MPKVTWTETVTMTTVDCAECGLIFGITDDFESRRRKDHRSFHCPAGHNNYYAAETREEALKRELDGAQSRLALVREDLAVERKSHAATKGQLTKERKRVHNGVCPACNRHFEDLERHMHTKHPRFAAQD